MKFYGFEKLSLIDYDRHTAATIFTGGCNFYCPFCHNGGLVDMQEGQKVFEEEEILAYLKKRVGLLDGLAITGGEPTLHRDLPEFIKKVKNLGYDVKLDTNGTNPDMLTKLIKENLVDYLAMDIKTSPKRYPQAIGKNYPLDNLYKSIEIIKKSGKQHEFRTTAIKEFAEKEDFYEIAELISGADKYVIQHYRDSDGCLSHGYSSFSEEEVVECLYIVAKTVKSTALRGY